MKPEAKGIVLLPVFMWNRVHSYMIRSFRLYLHCPSHPVNLDNLQKSAGDSKDTYSSNMEYCTLLEKKKGTVMYV